MNHLDLLVASALTDLAARTAKAPLAEVRARAQALREPHGFAEALSAARARGVALIAEVKRSSPSRGAIAPQLDPAQLAKAYERGGAACLSVLTDREHFGGSLEDLALARRACSLPVLRKDFLVTPYQIYEARAHGADAVLLIAAAVPLPLLLELRGLARELRMCVLLEVHEAAELETARACGPDLLGVNARNLKTLQVHGDTFARLAPLARGIAPLVAESGVKSSADARRYLSEGADALLVGESLSSSADPESATRALVQA